MNYDFDSVIDRRNTNSIKWDFAEKFFSAKDLLPMWVADMDFRAPPEIIDAVRKVAERGIYGYSGVPQSYYEAVISWMKRRHNWEIKQEWMAFSPGVVPAIHLLVQAFTQPGDQVILQTPVYYPFFNAVKCNGREILDNPLRLEGRQYTMDLEDLERKITSRTKMLVLCNPHNPISRVWREEELRRLGEMCIKNKILVVSDEIHEDIVYSGYKHVPFTTLSEELAANCITCTAASKTFNLPGLQTSNIIFANPDLKARFTDTVRSCSMPSPNMFGIAATEAAYCYGEPWLTQLLEYLECNVSFLTGYISARIPGLKVIQPQGTYLLWLDFRGCGIDPARLANFVREDAKVGLEPGTIFGCKEEGFERMNIACPRAT
ncbi:MAG: pyridoxal phosphate-dependent aminotransferase, partial [Chloroflexi bacterium]|nr:pyridoxal phosphate-dependent aminotransferase [Chloroflexota bacterium]